MVLVALVLRLLFAQFFFSPDDDVFYLRDAYALAHGHFVHNTHWALRLGVVAPTALFIRVFGLHDWSVILYPLTIALSGIPLIYAFGSVLFNRTVGLVAALLLACFPEHIYFSTLVMADLPGAFWGALATFLAYRSRGPLSPSRCVLTCIASGLAVVLSYLCWEPNLIFAPACCMAAIWNTERRYWALRLVTILTVVVLGLGIESVAYWRVSGDPLLRWTIARHAEAGLNAGMSPLAFVVRVPRLLLIPARRQFFFYSWLLVWAVVYLRHRWKQAPVLFLALWLAGFLLFIGYGIYSLHPLRALFNVEYVRYFDDLTFPAILLIAKAIYETRPRPRDVA